MIPRLGAEDRRARFVAAYLGRAASRAFPINTIATVHSNDHDSLSQQLHSPPDGTGFVSSPNARGTLDILWSCLSILVLSTWSILHLNVPTQSTPSEKTQDYKRKAIRFLAKLKWMAVNIVAPEWALGKAWSDYQSVSTLEEAFDVFRQADEVPWSRAHTYFANMGGFAIRFTEETHQAEEELEPTTSDPTYNDTTTSNQRTNVCHGLSRTQNHTTVNGENHASKNKTVTSADPDAIALLTRSTRIPRMSSSRLSSSDNPQLGAIDLCPTSGEAEELGSRTDDKENGESHKQELPMHMRTYFHIGSQRGIVSTKSLRRSIGNLSRSIGTIDWTTNDTNIHTIKKALEIVAMEHFKTKWERRRLLQCYTHWFHNLHVLQGDLWILDAHQLLVARELGILKTLPKLSNDEIDDKTKDDALFKVLALGQVIWFFIQMGTRLSYHIPTSQLEIVVFSFAICTALTYGLLLDKPKDASTSVTVNAVRYPTPEKMIRIAIAGPRTWGHYRRSIWIPNNAIHRDSKRPMVSSMVKMNQGSVLALIIFGAVHCVAWDFDFPTQVEKVFWRVCSLATMVAIPLGIGICNFMRMIWRLVAKREAFPREYEYDASLVNYTLTFVFVVCRLFIIVEMFRSFVTLPSGAFRTTWSTNLPHIG